MADRSRMPTEKRPDGGWFASSNFVQGNKMTVQNRSSTRLRIQASGDPNQMQMTQLNFGVGGSGLNFSGQRERVQQVGPLDVVLEPNATKDYFMPTSNVYVTLCIFHPREKRWIPMRSNYYVHLPTEFYWDDNKTRQTLSG